MHIVLNCIIFITHILADGWCINIMYGVLLLSLTPYFYRPITIYLIWITNWQPTYFMLFCYEKIMIYWIKPILICIFLLLIFLQKNSFRLIPFFDTFTKHPFGEKNIWPGSHYSSKNVSIYEKYFYQKKRLNLYRTP